MNTPTKVAAFAAGLAALFAAALGVGTLTGPVEVVGASNTAAAEHGAGHTGTSSTAGADQAASLLPGGLMVVQDGYALDLAERQLPTDGNATLEFRIVGPDGQPVTRYRPGHGKDLHLIVVRRDLAGYQHVHPELDSAGTWSVPLDLSDPGVYRVFADFIPADRTDGLTLGADLSVTGDYQPQPLPPATRTAEVDGYTVALTGDVEPGQETELTLSVSKGGRPVTDLQPYLEAYGHLVALRDRDLAYLHVHPTGSPDDGTTKPGPGITFHTTVPSAGSYRLFLDFRHDDQVRTAEFTVNAGTAATGEATTGKDTTSSSSGPASPTPAADGHDHHHGG
jgi:hypothetical protein